MVSTMRRRSAVLAMAGVAAAQWLQTSAPAQAAVPVSMVGWWTRSPSPPPVPDGGIAVGLAPDGEVSVGAIQLDTAGGAEAAVVSLLETGGRGQQAATIQVCTTSDSWSNAAGDDLDDAPRATCPADPILFTRGDDGTWTADVAPLVAGQRGPLSLMVLPAPAPESVPGVAAAPPFELAFDQPTVEGGVVPEGPSTDATPTPSAAAPRESSAPAERPLVAPPPTLRSPPEPAPDPVQAPALTPVTDEVAAGLPSSAVGATDGGPSRLAVLGFVLASLVAGAAAAGVHWAHAAGLFERVVPNRGGLQLPPPD